MKKVNLYNVRSGASKTLTLTSSIETFYSDHLSQMLKDNGYEEFDNKLIITEEPIENWLQKGPLSALPPNYGRVKHSHPTDTKTNGSQ